MTMEGIRTGTGTERWRERVPDFRGCDAETASAKWCADKRGREEISDGESEETSGMRGMQGRTLNGIREINHCSGCDAAPCYHYCSDWPRSVTRCLEWWEFCWRKWSRRRWRRPRCARQCDGSRLASPCFPRWYAATPASQQRRHAATR